jgi:CheY-like chemotaxis protein
VQEEALALTSSCCGRTVLAVGFQPQDEWLLLRQWFATRRKTRLTFRAWGNEVDQYLQLALASCGEIQPLPSVILLHLKQQHHVQELEFLRWVRHQVLLRDVLVIVCSDHRFEDDIKSAFSVGADFFLSEANEFSEVLQMLQRIETCSFDRAALRSAAS